MKSKVIADISEQNQFDEIVDVRTPAEFAIDHIPGAINLPVLSDEERAIVGTLHVQKSPFEANKVGSALIARHIADHIEQHFHPKEKSWKPLIYCWRGGKRSNSLAHVLRQIGWQAQTLGGGYKSYRRYVLDELQTLPTQFQYQVITGSTGSAKSRILEELHHQKAQVLDLELLANHKGSVLGGNIYSSQPSQKLFETNILKTLQQLNANQVVFIEAESRKIGSLQVPDSLLEKIRESPCIRIVASLQARVVFLLRDYDYMTQNPDILIEKLSHLKEIHGQNILNNWCNLINLGHWEQLIEELLVKHYDHLYKQSQIKNFSHFENAKTIQAEDLSQESIVQIAREINRNYACSVARPSTQGLI